MKTFFVWVLAAALFLPAPVYLVWTQLAARAEFLEKGKLSIKFWCPEDAEVVTTPDRWDEESSKSNPHLFLQVHRDLYRKEFADGKHLVWISNGMVRYQTYQGKVVVWAEASIRSGWDQAKSITYVGNGEVIVEPRATYGEFWSIIIMALLLGGIIDVLLAVVLLVIWLICHEIWYRTVRLLSLFRRTKA